MKRKLLAALLVAVTVSMAACGQKAENAEQGTEAEESTEAAEGTEAAESTDTDGSYLKDYTASDYVTLGEYKGLEISMTSEEPVVTEEDVDSYIEYIRQMNPVSTPVEGRAVQSGDTVNIDYEGKLDGVAFAGGTAQGQDLTIGSGSFIDGFEDGCIGMEIGETRDVEATFPDPYQNNTELSGKTAVFTVTVNSISIQEAAELNDDYVAGLGIDGVSTLEEYKSYAKDILTEQQTQSYNSEKADKACTAAEENCEFKEVPQPIVDRMNNTLTANITSYASVYGVDIGSYVAAYYGGDADDYQATLLLQAEDMTKKYLMLQAIADQENITVSEAEAEEELRADAELYGQAVEDYREMIDEEAFREYLLTQKVLDFLSENAVVTVEQAE